jgi:hypothetical protein
MAFIESGILDKSRLSSNILLIILVAGNLFFATQYIQQIKTEQDIAANQVDNTQIRLKTARFLKFFIDVVLNTKGGTITYDDRVKLEADVLALSDLDIRNEWKAFSGAKDTKTAQVEAVKLMSMLANRLI